MLKFAVVFTVTFLCVTHSIKFHKHKQTKSFILRHTILWRTETVVFRYVLRLEFEKQDVTVNKAVLIVNTQIYSTKKKSCVRRLSAMWKNFFTSVNSIMLEIGNQVFHELWMNLNCLKLSLFFNDCNCPTFPQVKKIFFAQAKDFFLSKWA